ncbi:unnamed protein product, partial [Linum tenue]
IGEGFRTWNKLKAFDDHVGEHNSYHNRAKNSSDLLLKQARGIEAALFRQSDQAKRDYRIRLVASLDCIRWLVVNGLSFRGHDESATSSNRGNFLQLLDFHALGREDVQRVIGRNAPKNLQLTSPKIQRDLIHAMACETTKKIIVDIGNNVFCILVDETRDISMKEQMAIVLRYVNSDGCVMERFLCTSHVRNTKALTLKKEIEAMLLKHGLSMSMIRGQGYDGASNMKGEINGLKTLILAQNSSAYTFNALLINFN